MPNAFEGENVSHQVKVKYSTKAAMRSPGESTQKTCGQTAHIYSGQKHHQCAQLSFIYPTTCPREQLRLEKDRRKTCMPPELSKQAVGQLY